MTQQTTMTKEQVRIRYFAAHIGCEVETNKLGCKSHIFCVRVDSPLYQYSVYDKDAFTHFDHPIEFYPLKLRPLSAITDEHWVLLLKEFEHEFCKDYSYLNDCFCFVYFDSASYIDLKYIPLNIADLLRSLGYHTGNFMGFCPIQEGWAVLNDKNDKI